MNKKKKLIVLCCILLAFAVGTIIVKNIEIKKEEIKVSGETVFSVDEDAVTKLSWGGSSDVSFTKTDGVWIYDEDDAMPVDQDMIAEILEYLSDVKANFVIENPEDLSQYGLASPGMTITVETSDGEKTISTGNYSNLDSNRYVMIGDGNVYLVPDDPEDHFSLIGEDYIDLDEIPDFTSNFDSITVKKEENISIIKAEDLDYCYSNEYEYYYKNGSTYEYLGTDKVEDYLDIIQDLSISSYAKYEASAEKLSNYGLEEPDITVSISYTNKNKESQTLTLLFGNVGDNYYFMMEGSEFIYYAAQSDYEDLMEANYESLRPSELILLDWDEATGLEFTLDGESYAYNFSDVNKDKNDEEISFDDIEDILDGIEVSEYTEDLIDSKLMLGVKVNLESEKYPSIELNFYQLDSDNCIVEFNGETYAKVPRADIVDLIEAVNAIIL